MDNTNEKTTMGGMDDFAAEPTPSLTLDPFKEAEAPVVSEVMTRTTIFTVFTILQVQAPRFSMTRT